MQTHGPVVVTGAAGFIGSHLVERLLREGHRVIGIDNFDPFYDPAIKQRHIADATAHAAPGAFELLRLDITDAPAIADAFTRIRPDTVYHLAAKAGVRPSIADPVGYMRTNVLGTASVLEASRIAGVRRIIVASSSSVYGNCPTAPFHEALDVSAPISPYAASKRATELLCHSHHHLTKTPIACLRFFTVFGPRQRPDLAISLFMRRIAAGQDITMFGDGSMSRDYTFVHDIVAGVRAAADRIDPLGFRIWNLGNSAPVSLRDLITAIGRVAGMTPVIRSAPTQPGDVERTWADLTLAARELNYHPATPLEEGLRQQWNWSVGESHPPAVRVLAAPHAPAGTTR